MKEIKSILKNKENSWLLWYLIKFLSKSVLFWSLVNFKCDIKFASFLLLTGSAPDSSTTNKLAWRDNTLVNVVPRSLVGEAWSTRDLGLLVGYCDKPECICWNATKFMFSRNLSYFVAKSFQKSRNWSPYLEYAVPQTELFKPYVNNSILRVKPNELTIRDPCVEPT